MLTGVEIKVRPSSAGGLRAAAADSSKPTVWRWQERFIASRQRGYQKVGTDHQQTD